MSRFRWLVAIASVISAIPTAQTYANISEAAVLFLRIASGARPAGMGEAFVAVADDATATHWNPAGLGRYPLSDLWMNVPVPRDRTISRFAVVENDVPERNYTRYDIWILTQASAGYFESDEFDNPRVTPMNIPAEGVVFTLNVDGQESAPLTVPGGVYSTAADFEKAVQSAIDAVLLESGVTARVVPSGDRSRLRITSGATGDQSVVKVVAQNAPAYLSGSRARTGNDPELLRATPPSHNARAGASELSAESEFSARVDYGIWKTGDVYEPDASENLLGIIRSRTGLPEGEELNARVAQVARLNQMVPTDSLRRAWDNVKALTESVPETLTVNMQTLFDANDVLNADPTYLADLIDEMKGIVESKRFEDDDACRLQVLASRAIVTYLPEKLTFPFALNLPGEVTALDSRDKSLYLGTSRGVLMYVDGRSVALSDSAAGPARGMIHDLKVSPSGVLWMGTDEGISRYSPTWTHFGDNQGWSYGPAKKIFVLGENDVFAYDGTELVRFDQASGQWSSQFVYQTTLGDNVAKLPGKVFNIQDSLLAARWADSLIKYNALDAGELQAGTSIRIPYHLALRGDVTALTRTADGVLWIGTSKGVVSIGTDPHVNRYGYAVEAVGAATTARALAEKFVGQDAPDRADLLAARIKSDNFLEGDEIAAGRKLEVFSAVPGSVIRSLQAEGNHVLAGTEYGTVEYRGEGEWYRYTEGNLEDYQVSGMSERSGERWFAASDRVVVYGKPRKEITFMHVKWLPTLADDLYYEFFGGVMPVKGWGTMGANITFLSLGTQTRVDEFGNVLGEFGTFELAATLSYGTRLHRTLAAGLSAKIIYSHLADQGAGAEQGQGPATGLALDVGTLWNTPIKKLDLGIAITNLGPNISYIDAAQADPLPRNLAVGLAYRLIHTPFNKLTLVGEVNKDLIGWTSADFGEQLDEAIFNGGLEYQYGSFIALRGGYIYDRQGDIKKPTLGAGIAYKVFQFDFAYIPSSSSNQPLDNTTRLSLSVRW